MIKYPPELWKHPILGLIPYVYPTPEVQKAMDNLPKQTVGLVMIAKNEGHVLKRCLESVKHLITTYTILLNGTTDNSESIIKEVLGGRVHGEVIMTEWKGFSETRNEALNIAEKKSQWLLLIDADDELECAKLPWLEADAYDCAVRYKETTYPRTFLIKSSKGFRFYGKIHETLDIPREYDRPCLTDVLYHYHADGASWEDPEKYRKYAEILRQELETCGDAERPSKMFMLAQSYKDAGMKREALIAYRNRIGMAGWAQEVFMSWMSLGELDRQPECWLRALDAFPLRGVEALYELTKFFNETGGVAAAWMFAKAAMTDTELKIPVALLVPRGVYLWRMLEQYAIAAYNAGERDISKRALMKLAEVAPEENRDVIRQNLKLLDETQVMMTANVAT
jgi:glycosyltransferase involved in cell wall biosynthesis